MCEENGRFVWKNIKVDRQQSLGSGAQKESQTSAWGVSPSGGCQGFATGIGQGSCRSIPCYTRLGNPRPPKAPGSLPPDLPEPQMSCEGGGGVPNTNGLFLGGAFGTAFYKASRSQVEGVSLSGWELVSALPHRLTSECAGVPEVSGGGWGTG
ncbi:hypothetical protein HJG60_009850 [Phyllostomus discolor]|uniref:Uncharacterized protein n=1 Tax=Phyllostomus discolor TaxID=89673 RepID=A0A834BCE4_9CHIR|nr:hypothetical protein HJG60_009850 [Phyllostomus discolor]